jgi:hypothetical protein
MAASDRRQPQTSRHKITSAIEHQPLAQLRWLGLVSTTATDLAPGTFSKSEQRAAHALATHVAEYYGGAGVSAACADAAARANCRIGWARSSRRRHSRLLGTVRALGSRSWCRRRRGPPNTRRTMGRDRMASHRPGRPKGPAPLSIGRSPAPWFHGASNTWLFSLVVVHAIDRTTVRHE